MKSEYDFFMRCSKKSHKVEPLLLTKTIMLKTTFWRCDYDKGLLKVKVQQGNLVSKQTLYSEGLCIKEGRFLVANVVIGSSRSRFTLS